MSVRNTRYRLGTAVARALSALLIILATAAAAPHAALGSGYDTPLQAMAAVDTTIVVDDIRITAVKQGADLRSMPVAATVIDGAALESRRMTTLREAAAAIPNLHVPDYGSRMTSSVYIRGLGSRMDQPATGMNVDNVPLMNKDTYDFDFDDVERIEVLRGPQSTLYGRNTAGGAINVYTLSPMTWQGLKFGAEYSSANSIRVRASYYARPLETFGVSVAAAGAHSDGFYVNEYDGSRCGGEDYGSARVKLQWRPHGRVRVDNVAAFNISKQKGYPYAYAGPEPLRDSEGGTVISPAEIRYDDPCGYDRIYVSDGLTVSCDGERFTFASVTAWQFIDDEMTMDNDFTPLPYFTLMQARRENIVTQDLVFRSRGEQRRYDWMCGAFAFFRSSKMHAPVTFKKTGIDSLIVKNAERYAYMTPQFTSDELLFDSRFRLPSAGAALYHESTVHAGPVDVAAGIRADFEYTRMDYDCYSDAAGTFGASAIKPSRLKSSLGQTFVEILPRITVLWRINARNALYMSATRGYKAGGFNTQMFSEVLQAKLMEQMHVYWHRNFDINKVVSYKPEHSINFEIGGHFASADGVFAGDAALFYIDCRNQQLTVFPKGQTTGRMMTNAGKSRSLGAELSARILPFENFSITLSCGYTDARFKEFASGTDNYAGNFVPYAPRCTAAARIQYTLKTDSRLLHAAVFGAGYNGTGPIWWDEANTLRQPYYSQIEADIRLVHKNWSLTLWGRNLTGTRYDVFRFASIEHNFLQRGKPRRLGVTLSLEF